MAEVVGDDLIVSLGSNPSRMPFAGTFMHELGHILGFEDLDPSEHSHDVMEGALAPGVRHNVRSIATTVQAVEIFEENQSLLIREVISDVFANKKTVNQLMAGAHIAVAAEAIAFAEKAGIDPALASGAFVTTVTDVVGFFANSEPLCRRGLGIGDLSTDALCEDLGPAAGNGPDAFGINGL